MLRRLIVAAWFTTFFLIGCPHPQAPEDPPFVPPLPTLDELDAGTSPCGRACERLRSFSCPEGFRSPGGATCVQVCTVAGGLVDSACVIGATDKSQLPSCGVRCKQ